MWRDVTWYDVMWYDTDCMTFECFVEQVFVNSCWTSFCKFVMWCDVMWYDAMRCDMIWMFCWTSICKCVSWKSGCATRLVNEAKMKSQPNRRQMFSILRENNETNSRWENYVFYLFLKIFQCILSGNYVSLWRAWLYVI